MSKLSPVDLIGMVERKEVQPPFSMDGLRLLDGTGRCLEIFDNDTESLIFLLIAVPLAAQRVVQLQAMESILN
jgi:hypothetical protein